MCLNNIACLILYSATDKKEKKHQDTATRHKQDLGYFRPCTLPNLNFYWREKQREKKFRIKPRGYPNVVEWLACAS